MGPRWDDNGQKCVSFRYLTTTLRSKNFWERFTKEKHSCNKQNIFETDELASSQWDKQRSVISHIETQIDASLARRIAG